MLRAIAAASLVLLSCLSARAADRPSFLVVITDDQRWDALGVVQRERGGEARFPWFDTPNMDRLAAGGTRFRNAFVVSALCSPSRAAFLTGRYNHENGVDDNMTPLAADAVTYASLLRDAGYATGYVGKWHMDGQRERPGFDWSASFVGQGRYTDCPVLVNGEETPTTGWVDDVSTDFAIDFLKRQPDGKPFCLVVGYKTPHGPRTPESVPGRLGGLYADVEARPAPNADAPPPYRAEGTVAPGRRRAQKPGDGVPTYFQLLTGVDQNLGRLLDALDETGRSEDTVVVFTSDNGYFLGEHGLSDKRDAYDESIRIPLLIRAPGGRAGQAVDAIALNIDLAPTLLDFAGVAVPGSMRGRSLRPLLEGEPPADWRTAFLYEYFEEPRYRTPTNFALRTTAAKLVVYPGHVEWTELYDLEADPYETKNLANAPEHAAMLRRMQAEFDRQAKAVGLPTASPEGTSRR
ncbi:MAG TPA: sulfatase [Planctomycetaceae bacterium]